MGSNKRSRIFDFYPLEDRILLSGEGLDGAEMSVDADPDFAASLLADMTADGEASVDPALAAGLDPTSGDAIAVPQDVADSPTFDPALPLEVVFVDSAVDDAETLLDGLRGEGDDQTQWLVVELAADQDGIEQITATLSELSGVDAIHIVSHGDGQGIQLGNARLDAESAQGYSGDLASWAGSLDQDADLLIYGCDLASTSEGRALIDSIAALADCDVAASDDATGHESLGGDWQLEYTLGEIESAIAFSFDAQQDWWGVLETADPSASTDSSSDGQGEETPSLELNELALAFEQNTGQTDSAVDYLARGEGYSVFLTEGDAVIDLEVDDSRHVVRLDLVGANLDPEATGLDPLAMTSNYLIGDSANWQTDVTNFSSVRYESVYDGIDLRYYGNQRQLQYDFIVDAYRDPNAIRLNFDGVIDVAINDAGELELMLDDAGNFITFAAPFSYQYGEDGSLIEVQSAYIIHDDGTVGFTLGEYDISRELVIDPVLNYSTVLGGTGNDAAYHITEDGAGNVYVLGTTYSTDFPATTGSHSGSADIYVAKLTLNGSGGRPGLCHLHRRHWQRLRNGRHPRQRCRGNHVCRLLWFCRLCHHGGSLRYQPRRLGRRCDWQAERGRRQLALQHLLRGRREQRGGRRDGSGRVG